MKNYQLFLVLFVIIVVQNISLAADQRINFTDDIVGQYRKISIVPKYEGKGDTIVYDQKEWSLSTPDDKTHHYSRINEKQKVVLKFNNDFMVNEASWLLPDMITFENQDMRLTCNFEEDEKYCEIYKTSMCEKFNRLLQEEFQGSRKELEKCSSKFIKLLLASTTESEKISKVEVEILKRYQPFFSKESLEQIGNFKEIKRLNRNNPNYSEVEAVFNMYDLCRDRDLLKSDKEASTPPAKSSVPSAIR